MKAKQLLFIVAAFAASLFTLQANAKIWRVNNLSNYNGTTLWGDNMGGTISNPVFAQLGDANTSNLVSATGIDTLHLEGTNIVYDAVAFTKGVVIIGPGYFLDENPNVSNTVMEAQVGRVRFHEGSDGSQLIGIHATSSLGIGINANDILIKRCEIDYGIDVNYTNTDITVVENYFSNKGNSTSSAISSSNLGFPSDFIFNNNICKRPFLLSFGSTIYNAVECNNNVFDCPAISGKPSIEMNVSSFKNNILKTNAATVNINNNVSNSNVSYNVSSSASGQFGTGFNNIVVSDMSAIFVNAASNTTDGDYQVADGSVADNTGSDGTDRGAFGGASPASRYTLSGLANIPVIYDITTPGATSTNLPVTIKARTIK